MADQQPLSRAEYDALAPEDQGVMSYWQGAWNLDIPRENPYPVGSHAARLWDKGHFEAVLAAQDSEE